MPSLFRSNFRGPMISAAAYTPAATTITVTVAEGDADAIAFGRMFIENPDLVERIQKDLRLNRIRPVYLLRGRGTWLHRLPDVPMNLIRISHMGLCTKARSAFRSGETIVSRRTT
jgi:hypothetical protein